MPSNTLVFKLSNSDDYWTARTSTFAAPALVDERDKSSQSTSSAETSIEAALAERGNLSDPGPSNQIHVNPRVRKTAATVWQERQEQERLLAERSTSTTEIRLKEGFDDLLLKKVINKERVLDEMKREIRACREGIDRVLQADVFQLELQYGQQAFEVAQRSDNLQQLSEAVKISREHCEDRRCALKARKEFLKDAWTYSDSKIKGLSSSQAGHELDMYVSSI